MKVLRLLLRASPLGFAVAAFLSFVGGASSSVLLYLITQGMSHPTTSLGIAFAIACVARFALELLSHATLARLSARLAGDLRMRIADAALSTSYADLEGIGLVRVRNALTEDAQALAYAGGTFVTAATAAAVLIGGFGYLLWMSWPAAIGAVALCGLAFFVTNRFASTSGKIMRGNNPNRMVLQRSLLGVVGGAKELKLHSLRRAGFVEGTFRALARVHSTSLRAFSYLLVSETIGQATVFLALAAAVMTLALLDTPSSTLAGVVVATLFVQGPLSTLFAAVSSIGEVSGNADQLEELLGELSMARPKSAVAPAAAATSFERLELRGVSFAYPGRGEAPFRVGPVDVEVRPGEILFVIGGNGSGKSTLAKVLVGLYTQAEGEILVDGKAVASDEERERYRQLFAVVFAEGHVFQELWGAAPESVDETANALLKDLQLEHKVKVAGGKFTTTQLSQGQRKRLALVAAYLEARPIFVFDEWAADQDPEFKRAFYTHFLPALKKAGKAVIVISHDDHYFGVADRVLRLDRGAVVAPSVPQAAERVVA